MTCTTSSCFLLGVKENDVKSLAGNLDGDLVPIRPSQAGFLNRARIKDSVDFMNTSLNNFSLFLSSSNLCFFALEGYNGYNVRISLPDKSMVGNVALYDSQNSALNRQSQFLQNILIGAAVSLSNYLYKLY